jgi:DNA-directed RNA polymerase specialized sigma24 family protein
MTDSEEHQSPPLRRRWELNREAWEALLRALAPDRETAGLRYESLRRRLVDLFAWERCPAPEELADDALNRLARKVAEGVDIPHLDRYAFGIARFLVQEDARTRRSREAALRIPHPAAAASDIDPEMVAAIQSCLGDLPAAARDLIQRYYAEDRAALARGLGINGNALRNRALRIRASLQRCASRKLGRRDDW